MNAESGALIKTGVNEQVLLVSQRSERALIEREYQKLAKIYTCGLVELADSLLAEKITLEMDAEQVAAIDLLLVYKIGRMRAFAARFCMVNLFPLVLLQVLFMKLFFEAAKYDLHEISKWLKVRRKMRQLKGHDFSPYDALRK